VANTWRNRYLNQGGQPMTTAQQGFAVLTSFTTGAVFAGSADGSGRGRRHLGRLAGESADDPNAGFRLAGLASADAGSPYVEGNAYDKDRYPSMKPGTLWGAPFRCSAPSASERSRLSPGSPRQLHLAGAAKAVASGDPSSATCSATTEPRAHRKAQEQVVTNRA
jgi:hypothetical protein